MILQKQNKVSHEFFQYFDYIPVLFRIVLFAVLNSLHIVLFAEFSLFQIPVPVF